MPIEAYYKGKGKKVLRSMQKQYGKEKGKKIFYATAKKQHQEPQDENLGIIHTGTPAFIPGQMPEYSGVSEGILTKMLRKRAKDVIVRKLFRRNKTKITIEDSKGKMELSIPEDAALEKLLMLKKDYLNDATKRGLTPHAIKTIAGIMDASIMRAG